MFVRQDGWESRLVALATEVQSAPWAWGETDCATLMLRSVALMANRPLATVREVSGIAAYHTRFGALRQWFVHDFALDPLTRIGMARADGRTRTGDVLCAVSEDPAVLPYFGVVIERITFSAVEGEPVGFQQTRDVLAAVPHVQMWRMR